MRQLHRPSAPSCTASLADYTRRSYTFFVIEVSFIILNVFSAVILEHFEVSMNEETSMTNTLNIKDADVEAFDEAWSLFIEQQYK